MCDDFVVNLTCPVLRESVIHHLKLNNVTALFILLLLPYELIYSILLAHDSQSA